jgi:hypothetical protein
MEHAMSAQLLSRGPGPQTAARKTFLDVPWPDAEGLQSHLMHRGIASTICWDPATRQAKLELPAGTNIEQVHHAILDWIG